MVRKTSINPKTVFSWIFPRATNKLASAREKIRGSRISSVSTVAHLWGTVSRVKRKNTMRFVTVAWGWVVGGYPLYTRWDVIDLFVTLVPSR
jgi:hypothetical protein